VFTESIVVQMSPMFDDADLKATEMPRTRSPLSVVDEKKGRRKLIGPEATADAIAGLIHADPAKALVMRYVRQLVADGHADWGMLENGTVQLRCKTGETFLLGETMIVRIA
jgi:hypothetical protein